MQEENEKLFRLFQLVLEDAARALVDLALPFGAKMHVEIGCGTRLLGGWVSVLH